MTYQEISPIQFEEAAAALADGPTVDAALKMLEIAGDREVLDFAKDLRTAYELRLGDAVVERDSAAAERYRRGLVTVTEVIIGIIEEYAEAQDE